MNTEQRNAFVIDTLHRGVARIGTLIESLPEDQRLPATLFGARVAAAQVEATLDGVSSDTMTALVDHFKTTDAELREVELVLTQSKNDGYSAAAA